MITIKDDKIQIRFPYNLDLIEKVKQIPGRKWVPEEKVWEAPDCWVNRCFVSHYFSHTIDKMPPLPESHPVKLNKPSFKHQEKATGILLRGDNLALFAETGVGKTKIIIDLFCNTKGPHLVVCPPPLIKVWKKQCMEWGQIEAKIIHGPKRTFDPAEVNITSYQTLVNDVQSHFPYNVVVFDESHLVKDPNADRSKAARKVKGFQKIVMTGTPYGNEMKDLFSQIHTINPFVFGSWSVFAAAFCEYGGYDDKEIVGYKNQELLFELLKRCSIIIKKQDCLDLPPKIYQTITLNMNSKQQESYDRILEGGLLDMPITGKMAEIAKLRQVSSGFAYYDGQTLVYGTEKTEWLSSMSRGEPTIIWYNFDAEKEDILSVLPGRVAVACGSTDSYKAAEDFESGKTDILVAQMATLKYGYTLNRASRVIYYSPCWSSLDRSQSEDRCHRIGQDKKVSYTTLISSPIEEHVHFACINKLDTLDYIISKLSEKSS